MFYRNPIREMEHKAKSLLPKSPGIIFPGWFWHEWALVGVVAIIGASIYFIIDYLGH